MATRATPTMIAFANSWKALYKSAEISGIVGDTDHAERGGYHISIQDQRYKDDYSILRPDDKAPPGTWPRDAAAAVDMNLDLADMKVCHGRLVAVWRTRTSDPRAKYINAHNGWDGNGDAGRYDWYSGSSGFASADHKWHVHLEIRRRYVNDPTAMKAILSILRGESLASYLGDDDLDASQNAKLNAVFDVITRWRAGMPTLLDGKTVNSPVEWRIRDEAWQKAKDEELKALKTDVASIKAAVATPPGTVVVTDEQLERVLRKVIGSVDQ
ncbi:hypothetical protein [Micromonospora sp. CA-246542]|uniref:hypothetical protein n=1 Tax=Micromonospora sp. CA-246542 TaxID=3239959 RepID=UPI003D942E55